MSKLLLLCILLACCVYNTHATHGGDVRFVNSSACTDVSELHSVADWKCLIHNASMSFAIVRSWHSTGVYDTNCHTSGMCTTR